jgi:hypothetical protein
MRELELSRESCWGAEQRTMTVVWDVGARGSSVAGADAAAKSTLPHRRER